MKQQKKGKKTNQGITLIALVVTIVVLIILATVSINAVFGENGIIQSSNNARLLSEQGTVLEDLRMEIYGKMSNPEFGEVGGLQYLKEQTEGKLREDNTIDVTKVREGIKSGRGSLDTGDVYYIENAELFYLDKEKNKKNLGQIFSDAESLNSNLEIKKEVTSTPANGERYAVGEEVKYRITVTNKGTETVKDIKIEDTLTAVDIVTGEETERLSQTFEKLTVEVEGEKRETNLLGGGQTGYIEYSYKVQSDDVGKELSNLAIVKGKNAIPTGEKPVITPVELPTTITLTKKVDYSKLREDIYDDIIQYKGQFLSDYEYTFNINFKDKNGNALPFEVVTPRKTFEKNQDSSQGGTFKLRDGESASIILYDSDPSNILSLSEDYEELVEGMEISDYGPGHGGYDYTSDCESSFYEITRAIDSINTNYMINSIASRAFYVTVASPGGEENFTLEEIKNKFNNSILALNVLRNYLSASQYEEDEEYIGEHLPYIDTWRSKLFQPEGAFEDNKLETLSNI